SWDLEKGPWQIDSVQYDVVNQRWLRKVSPPFQAEPSDWEVFEVINDGVLGVTRSAKSGMVKVSLELMSPNAAQQWLQWLIEDVNQAMRERDIAEARGSIEYLQKQLQETSIAEMKQIFYELIEEQTKAMMLAEVQQEYVLKVIDPAVVPQRKVSPRRSLIIVAGALLGILCGGLWVIARFLIVRSKKIS
ncbi:MAG: GNVR domain-containing protein, partial [Spongiibacteraceae bacterium]